MSNQAAAGQEPNGAVISKSRGEGGQTTSSFAVKPSPCPGPPNASCETACLLPGASRRVVWSASCT